MLDERTEALLIKALSTASGGETVAIRRHAEFTALQSGDLLLMASPADDDAPEPATGDLTPSYCTCGNGIDHGRDCPNLHPAYRASGDLAPDTSDEEN